MRLLLLNLFLLLAVSCGQTTAQQIDGAIDIALSHLTDKRCDDALEVLKKVNGHSDAVYLQVLASAYACKANYREITFIVNDLSGITATDEKVLMKSLAIMSTSVETITDSIPATNLILAAQTSLSGRSQAERDATFGLRKSGDLSVQALLLNIANLGKFLNYYGNVNAAGEKGGGTHGKTCFLNYTYNPAQAPIQASKTGACTTLVDGHPDLNFTTPAGKRRVCHGVTSLTNILDILENLDLTPFQDFAVLTDISLQVDKLKQYAQAANLGYLIEELSQSKCEQYLQDPSKQNDMELFFALVFETSLQ